jgi:arylformamidase
MNIYDISQEVFSGRIFPGDTAPSFTKIRRMETGDSYNLSDLQMCVHNATHIDAPAHFLPEGKTIEQIELSRCIGPASVIAFEGIITANDIRKKLQNSEKRLLFKGSGILTPEAATELNKLEIILVGTESQTIGNEEHLAAIHLELLKKEVVILEGLVLKDVPAGNYFLFAAPLKLGGVEGAPCRAILTDQFQLS